MDENLNLQNDKNLPEDPEKIINKPIDNETDGSACSSMAKNAKQKEPLTTKKKVLLYGALFLSIFLLCLCAGFLYGYFNYKKTHAAAEELNYINAELYSPDDYYLYQKLVSPKYAYENDRYFAVLENGGLDGDKHSITVYDKVNRIYREFKAKDYGITEFNDLGKIAVYSAESGDYVIFQHDLKLFSINIKTGVKADVVSADAPGSAISVRTFDYCGGKNFIIAKDNSVNIFSVLSAEENSIILKQSDSTGGDTRPSSNPQSCVALNNNYYFYNVDSKIYKVSLNPPFSGAEEAFSAGSSISNMAASADKLFFISNGRVLYLDIADFKASPKVALENLSSDKLGYIELPESLFVYNEELAVIDRSTATIQFFTTTADGGNNFTFTGKAVATNEKTDNRIYKNTTSSSLYGKNLAFFSGSGVKIVNLTTGEFTEFPISLSNATDFRLLSLGDKSVVVSDGVNVYYKKINGKDESFTEIPDINTEKSVSIYSSSYIFGKYFFLSMGATGKYLTVVDEDSLEVTRQRLNIENSIIAGGGFMTVDADGYLYIYVKSSNSVYKYSVTSNTSEETAANDPIVLTHVKTYDIDFNNLEYAVSLSVDLCENVYALSNNNRIAKIAADGTVKFFNLSLNENLSRYGGAADKKASNLALNYDNKTAYIIYSEQSFILTTDDLENESADNILKPEGLSLSAANGNPDVKKVTVGGKCAFRVNLDKERVFGYEKQLFATDKEYLLIGETGNGYGILLSGEGAGTEILLVKSSEITSGEIIPDDLSVMKVVSSSVNLYRYPVITQNNLCCIYTGEDKPVRLEVGTVIEVVKTFDFNGKTYYYVGCTVNDDEYSGFIPATFTADEIINKTAPKNYKLKQVAVGTVVYDKDMNEVYTFDAVTSVKAGEEENGYVTVIYKKDGTYYSGLIKASDVIKNKDDSLKNFLLITLSTFALFIVAVFFINKKKTYVTES